MFDGSIWWGEECWYYLLDESPWWTCIKCADVFYSATCCCCDNCNPFSGYCRTCHPFTGEGVGKTCSP